MKQVYYYLHSWVTQQSYYQIRTEPSKLCHEWGLLYTNKTMFLHSNAVVVTPGWTFETIS